MKLYTRAFHHDYYNEDLDFPSPVGRHDSVISRAKQHLKRAAAKARRRDARIVAERQLTEWRNG